MRPFISGQSIGVDFPVYENSHRSLKKAIIGLSTGGYIGQAGESGVRVVRALDNLDFQFNEGDRVGLVGHNGSGKTTLLRVLSGVYSPVQGRLSLRGKVASLLDIGMGLDPDATGFENIVLRGILTGQKPQETRKKIDSIAAFSELGEYLNLPVRTYSSGMSLRLAFSISTSFEADIVLMDEWLSVGDSDFSEKAENRLLQIVGKSSILVLATHSQSLLHRICNRKIVLEHGRIVEDEAIDQSD